MCSPRSEEHEYMNILFYVLGCYIVIKVMKEEWDQKKEENNETIISTCSPTPELFVTKVDNNSDQSLVYLILNTIT